MVLRHPVPSKGDQVPHDGLVDDDFDAARRSARGEMVELRSAGSVAESFSALFWARSF